MRIDLERTSSRSTIHTPDRLSRRTRVKPIVASGKAHFLFVSKIGDMLMTCVLGVGQSQIDTYFGQPVVDAADELKMGPKLVQRGAVTQSHMEEGAKSTLTVEQGRCHSAIHEFS